MISFYDNPPIIKKDNNNKISLKKTTNGLNRADKAHNLNWLYHNLNLLVANSYWSVTISLAHSKGFVKIQWDPDRGIDQLSPQGTQPLISNPTVPISLTRST